ncbi:molybdopterin-dependent oxidoreductase [Marinicellulosiphila megalodicopiae]|uniref:molybdopterin-dependent oxidoreductase n=1 Tax=Marinicellulosiphila megalodicopiae TaxID=2724896 RepID=UPI003BAE280A
MSNNLTKYSLEYYLNDHLVKNTIQGFTSVADFINQYHQSKTMQQDTHYQRLHQAITTRSSVCSFCGVGCSFTVAKTHKQQERLIATSDLGLCVKGQSSLLTGGFKQRQQRLAHKQIEDDRITSPMIRGHNGKLKAVSWDEALDRAAWLFLHVREWVGPEAVAIYGNGQKTIEAIWMASLYKLVFNIPTMGANSEHCLASAGAAHTMNFGNEAAFTQKQFAELEKSDVIILHGTNAKITFPQAFEKIKRNTNAIKYVIDPVKSDSAVDICLEPKGEHIQFEQGADILFNLAVCRIILENNWQDQTYIDQHIDSVSFAEFKSRIMQDDCQLDNVAKNICLENQTPQQIKQTILEYAQTIAKPNSEGYRKKIAIVSSMGINQSTGSYGFSTNLNILLLTGNVGREGAGSVRIAGQSNAPSELMLGFNSKKLVFNLNPLNDEHRQKLADELNIPLENIPNRLGTAVNQMANDDLLYCFIFIGTQFTKNMPRLGHWLRRLGRSFNIVIDCFMAQGVEEYADVVFPSLTYSERTGTIQRGDRTLQLQQNLTQAPENAWHDEQILARLALKIAQRLQNEDTAKLNKLDAKIVHDTFAKYLDQNGNVMPDKVFDQVVKTSKNLEVYNQLVDEKGCDISHQSMIHAAGHGVQWQGNSRYQQKIEQSSSQKTNPIFPSLMLEQKGLAKVVTPPEHLIKNLIVKQDDRLRSLITGRGRPGLNLKHYIARYNSGVKTLPITGKDDDQYWLEISPSYATKMHIVQGQLIRICSQHGFVFCHASINELIEDQFPFLDFVPGEINRLTSYMEADANTNQSFIKRTPIRITAATQAESKIWQGADVEVFSQSCARLFAHIQQKYPTFALLKLFLRTPDNHDDWLSWSQLQLPKTEQDMQIAEAVAVIAGFVQQFMNNQDYKKQAAKMLHQLTFEQQHHFYSILMPILRKLDYSNALLPLLSETVGDMIMLDQKGDKHIKTLFEAHNSAVLELKEEVVGVQLYVAIKRACDQLFGKNNPVPMDDISIVSGIAIPCAGDVPAYLMGVSPADLHLGRLIHCRAIGGNSIMVINTKTNQSCKVDVHTGILPNDKELNRLRGQVIAKKQAATDVEHRHFFDVLEELILEYVYKGDENFSVYEAQVFPWQEFKEKLSFAPANKKAFREHLIKSQVGLELTNALVSLNILDEARDQKVINVLHQQAQSPDLLLEIPSELLGHSIEVITEDTSLSAEQKIIKVIDKFIGPVLENDGGKIDYLGFDAVEGEVSVRFIGSCANCPCSMLSLETIVKPPLLKIEGVKSIVHRGKLRNNEIEKIEEQRIDFVNVG